MQNARFSSPAITRRRFLQQTFVFSAAVALSQYQRVLGASDIPAEDLHYLILGDWGYGPGLKPQSSVAEAMKGYVTDLKMRPDGLFLIGDNFYGDFKGGVDCPRWKTDFEDMYPATHFPGPCWAILGNHDYDDEPVEKLKAELAYEKAKPGTRWRMPAKWYRLDLPEKNPVATFLMLDSDYNNSKLSLTNEEKAAQMKWFEAELQKPRTTPWLFVVGHHPIYSNGKHGDNPDLIEAWEPLLKKYNVQFYVFGHDHDLQHLEFEGHPTSFVGSGGGGANLYELRTDGHGPYAGEAYGFTHLHLNKDRVIIRHLDPEQKQLHAFSKTPDGKVSILS